MNLKTMQIIQDERDRQARLGYNAEHDSHHNAGHFALLIEKQLADLKSDWYGGFDIACLDKLVAIASLSIAAIETIYPEGYDPFKDQLVDEAINGNS